MLDHPKISVIIPIYNVEEYLSECLNSIATQSYHNLDIVCVDDGSTDNSYNVALEYLKRDDRFRLIKKENGGLSSARNIGLYEACGEYVIFVDSDDLLKKNAVKIMLEEIINADADILVFGAELFPVDTLSSNQKIISSCLKTPNRLYLGDSVLTEALFDEKSCNIFVWNKMYKRNVLQGRVFDEKILLGEDRCFLFDVFPSVKRLKLIEDNLYMYRQKRKESLTNLYQNKAYERTRWKIKLLEHIFREWYFGKSKIPTFAKERLLQWSDMYIKRSLSELSNEEAQEIVSAFQSIVESAINCSSI